MATPPVQETYANGKWKDRLPEEGFFVTTDLSAKELDNVLKSSDTHKWDPYLETDNVKKMKIVSFANCQLDKVPMSLCRLTSLTRLYLTENNLKKLPTEFSHLMNLTALKLGWNNFTTIPEALCKLPHLKVLGMPNNKLTNDGLNNVTQLSKLEQLYLTSNKLQGEFPLSICNVTSLMLLDIKHNRITTLPDDISKLTELRVLNARGNDIQFLPPRMIELKRLKVACFAENRIESVNLDSFLKLPDLKDLCLFSNRLENRDELEKYFSLFKSNGKLLRVTENRAEITQQITCDSPYEFCRQDVTFIHDGSPKVDRWVKTARDHLEQKCMSSTVKSPDNDRVDILRDMRSSYVNVPVLTGRFHEMLHTEDPRCNLRNAIHEYFDKQNEDLHFGHFLFVHYGEGCTMSSVWFSRRSDARAASINVIKVKEAMTDADDMAEECADREARRLNKEHEVLCNKIREIMNSRLSVTSIPI